MVYFFSKKGKSNLLALIDCVNAFVFCFVLFCFVFFSRLARILKLRKKVVSLLLKGFVGAVVVFSPCDLVVSFK